MLDPSILVNSSTIPTVVGVDGNATKSATTKAASTNEIAEAKQQIEIARRNVQVLAATVEIQSKLSSCRDLTSAANQAVSLLAATLPTLRIQIAWRYAPSQACQHLASSDNSGTASSQWLAAAEEISHRGEVTVFPTTEIANRHALLAVDRFAKTDSANKVIAVPLVDSQNNNRGALLAVQSSASDKTIMDRDVVSQLTTIADGLANKLSSLQEIQPRRWEQIVRGITSQTNAKRRKVTAIAAALIALGMLVPLPYKVAATCELQPVHRRMIVAPFEGPLASVTVRPGDIVQSGQLLATINPRELDFELASLNAELRRAIAQKKGLLAQHDIGGGEIATLEAQRLQLQQDLLLHRRENLEIRSPLTGIVVTGDLERSVGSPFEKGDPLFELAPLDSMVVEIAIPERDFTHVQVGMPVQITLNAITTTGFDGIIEHVHPSAALRDGDNVFIAEVRLANADSALRPGMRGRVRIKSDRHTLGWNLFHNAYHSTRNVLGW